MALANKQIRKKVKDDSEGLDQANRIIDLLEEAHFSYDLGIAEPFFIEIQSHLGEAIRFYNRHKQPDSNLCSMAKRQLRLANKMAATTLIQGLNMLLEASGHSKLTLPVLGVDIERACHKLFYYVGESSNVGESKSVVGVEDGVKDPSALSMA